MTTDFRALCAELIASWDADGCDWKPQHQARWEATVNRARAALAEPECREPAAVTGQPSDEELALIYHDCCRGCEFMDQVNFENAARAVLTRWGNPAPTPPADGEVAECTAELEEQKPRPDYDRVQKIATEAQIRSAAQYLAKKQHCDGDLIPAIRYAIARWGSPAPPPADGEVAELVAWLRMQGEAQKPGPKSLLSTKTKKEMHANGSRLIRAAELLERQVVVPVAVSVRLPGPEDCDAEGRCWWFAPETEVDFGGWTFGTTEICANSQWVDWENTHWLPAHALPLPEVGE